jgi:hypothetical protein
VFALFSSNSLQSVPTYDARRAPLSQIVEGLFGSTTATPEALWSLPSEARLRRILRGREERLMEWEPKSSFGASAKRAARRWAREDAARERAKQQSKTYSGADLRKWYSVDANTGCWLWIGEFRRYGEQSREMPIARGIGKHGMCGTPHNAMSRVLFEEDLGRILKPTENVVGICEANRGERHGCVNPAHHEIRRGPGIMFAREMIA